ncbi:hypothetical protein [Sphaerisporangium sp. NPDC051011]|uniref:hypothetical protein n=1 Tax=Sphaerisporangium sp. NPDC051011 TaxID=3155792 RepID=UPI003411E4DD
MSEARRAERQLIELLTRTRRDWKERDVRQVLAHLQHTGWPWERILRLFPATAADTGSRPGDVIGAWRHPNEQSGTAPTSEYRAARAQLPGGGDPRAHPQW